MKVREVEKVTRKDEVSGQSGGENRIMLRGCSRRDSLLGEVTHLPRRGSRAS